MIRFEPFLAFDIETIPDIEGIREHYGIPEGIGDEEAHEFVCRLRRQQGQSDFLPLPLHKVAVISCAMLGQGDGEFRLFSLETIREGEKNVVRRFFAGIDKYRPQLLSWNGKGFDMPVLHYRCLHHGQVAKLYWESGDNSKSFKWNNYTSRYHPRHWDLMDTLALHQARSNAKLDVIARQAGLPGKMGMDGSKVWGAWMREEYDGIRFYCETDAVSTLLVGLEFARMKGTLGKARAEEAREAVLEGVAKQEDPRWSDYLDKMGQAPGRDDA